MSQSSKNFNYQTQLVDINNRLRSYATLMPGHRDRTGAKGYSLFDRRCKNRSDILRSLSTLFELSFQRYISIYSFYRMVIYYRNTFI